MPTFTSDYDMATLETDTGVVAWSKIGVTPVAGEPLESVGQPEAVALCDTSGQPDVLARTVVLACYGGFVGERVKAFNPLVGYRHWSKTGVGELGDRWDQENTNRAPSFRCKLEGKYLSFRALSGYLGQFREDHCVVSLVAGARTDIGGQWETLHAGGMTQQACVC